LLIDPGNILLEGQKYGFIGGTNGTLWDGKSIISGRINGHPNKTEILIFFIENKSDLIFLSHNKLIDIGTIITLNCQ